MTPDKCSSLCDPHEDYLLQRLIEWIISLWYCADVFRVYFWKNTRLLQKSRVNRTMQVETNKRSIWKWRIIDFYTRSDDVSWIWNLDAFDTHDMLCADDSSRKLRTHVWIQYNSLSETIRSIITCSKNRYYMIHQQGSSRSGSWRRRSFSFDEDPIPVTCKLTGFWMTLSVEWFSLALCRRA